MAEDWQLARAWIVAGCIGDVLSWRRTSLMVPMQMQELLSGFARSRASD